MAGLAEQEIRNELAAGGVLDRATIEGLAILQHELAGSASVSELVRSAGLRVVRSRDLPDTVAGLLVGTTILLRPKKLVAAELLAILHEVAHHLLRAVQHRHADVWRLTLALARPRGPEKAFRLALDDSDQIPGWALRIREEQLEAREQAAG